MRAIELNELADRVHAANRRWWLDDVGEFQARNANQILMLVISELAEAMEGHRKNLMDDKLPNRPMPEVELADALIRLLDVAGAYKYDLGEWRGRTPSFTGVFPADLYLIVRQLSYNWEAHRTGLHCLIMDGVYSILRLAAKNNMDLMGAFEEKMAYNAIRIDHTPEHRATVHGKKY